MSESHYSSGYVITDQSYAVEELGIEESRDVSAYMSNMRLNSPMTIPSQLSQAGMVGNGYPSQYSPNFQPIIQSNANSVVKSNVPVGGGMQHKQQQQTMMNSQRQRSSSANGPSSPPQSLQQLQQQQVDHKKQQHDLQMSFKVKIDKKPPSGQRPAKLDPESLQDKLTLGEDNPEVILEQATISELKDLLRSRGLPTTGKKSVLLERLKTPNSSQRITPLKLNSSSSSNPSPSSSPRMRNTSLTSPRYSPYTSIGLSPRTVVTSNPDLPGTRHIAALNLDSPVSREPVNSYRRDDPRFLIRNSSRQAFFNAYESALQEQPELDIQLPSNDTMIPIAYPDDWSMRQDPTLVSLPKTQSPISKIQDDSQTMGYYSAISDNQMDQAWYDMNSNGYYRNNT